MKQVFISYRHVKPDEDLAKLVTGHLRANGYSVFIDADIPPGDNWIAAIEIALKESDCLLVFLSKESIGSDMLRHEVKLAHQHKKRILPIRLGFAGDLPYDLGAYLHRFQDLSWEPEMSGTDLAVKINSAIPQAEVADQTEAPDISYNYDSGLSHTTEQVDVPLPVADPRLAASLESGTLQLSSPFYIRRAADDTAENCIDAAEATTIVRGPRQMGKSSLLARLHARAQALGHQSFYIDFQLMDMTHLVDLDHLFRYLARKIQRSFGITKDPRTFWDDSDGPKANMTYYLEDAILASAETPVHIIFDEAERLFEFSYKDDFFSTLRGWHNLRATNSKFTNFCVAIGHAQTPSGWIQDINQSPFNVGQQINVNGFEISEVAELNKRYGSPLCHDSEIEELSDFLGGHAYLTRLALYTLATRRCSFAEIVRSVDDQGGPFADHLRGIMWMLNKTPKVREAFREILSGRPCEDEVHYQCLWAVGLISGETRTAARPRSRLYNNFFKSHL